MQTASLLLLCTLGPVLGGHVLLKRQAEPNPLETVVLMRQAAEPNPGHVLLKRQAAEPNPGHVLLKRQAAEPNPGHVLLKRQAAEPNPGHVLLKRQAAEPNPGHVLLKRQAAEPNPGHVLLKRQAAEPNPLEPVVQQLAAAVDLLKDQVGDLQQQVDSGVSTIPQKVVAFHAQYSADNAVGVAQGPYVFDRAVLNEGDAYDTSTGVFTAPSDGIYMLAVQLFTDGGMSEHPFVDIKVNGDTLARMAFDEGAGQEDSDSTTVVTRLAAGDRVWVASEEGAQYHYWGAFHTFFTGTLLSASGAGAGANGGAAQTTTVIF